MFEHHIQLRAPLVGIRLAARDMTFEKGFQNQPSSHTLEGNQLSLQIPRKTKAPAEELNNDSDPIEAILTAILDTVRAIDDRRRQDLTEMQKVAVELSIAVASRLVHEKLNAGELHVEKLVERAVVCLEPNRPLLVHLHPTDLTDLETRTHGKSAPWSAGEKIRLVPDASMNRGDFRVDGEDFGVISQLESGLSGIRELLFQSLNDAQVERRKTMPGDSSLRRYPDRRETA